MRNAFGELNHPQSTTVDLDRAAIGINKLNVEGNNILGEAKVLSTPKGKVLRCLMDDKFKWGVSSRGLGVLQEQTDYKNVTKFKIVAIDAVANPSGPGCYVAPILEQRDYILESNGSFVEVNRIGNAIDMLEESVKHYPSHDVEAYKVEKVKQFLRSIEL
jgi:hypothetical protein